MNTGIKHFFKQGFLLVSFLQTMLWANPASAQKVALLITERIGAYERVANVIENYFGPELNIYNLKNKKRNFRTAVMEIKRQNPGLIIALGDKAAFLAAEQLSQFPSLIGMVLDLESDSLKRDHIEGVGLQIPPGNVLTQMRLIVPHFRRLGLMASEGKFQKLRSEIHQVGQAMGIEVSDLTIQDPAEIKTLLSQTLPVLDVLWLMPDSTMLSADRFGLIVAATIKAKKPLIVFSENFVRGGALFSVTPDYQAIGQQLTLLAERMLNHESVKPEKPFLEKFHYPIGSYSVLNQTTAQRIDLTIQATQADNIDKIIRDY